ncbi:MAG: hypothetical protein B9S32_04650 [Verrucomicrobia bacterium Tous-C9LFEB]|nr:MAG: hypothetical protein B9S32_04650 [Verrucomicrobia bacterium Tous-C9LFEB]
MLRKIIKIKNVGRFEDCRWRGGTQFESMVVLFAENARGKSTFCDVLRSCTTNSPDYVLGRHRLGSSGSSEVELLIDGGNLKFDGTSWNTSLPTLAIFDSTFIHQNVYAGDYIDHEHKKNLYHVILGAQGVQLAHEVEKLDIDIRATTKEITAKRDVLTAMLPHGTEIKKFILLQQDADIAAKIAAKEEEIKSAETATARATEIKEKGLLQEIGEPIFPKDFEKSLAEKLPTLAEEAEKKLRLHLSQHTKGATESWITLGLIYQKEDTCPLCGQNTAGVDLLSAYRAYFDRVYENFKKKLQEIGQAIFGKFGDKAVLTTQKILGDNSALWEFWKQLGVGEGLILPDISSLASVCGQVREQADLLLEKKTSAPLEVVILTDEFTQAINALKKSADLIAQYNNTVKNFNAQVTAFKLKQGTANIQKLRSELSLSKLVQARYLPDVVQALHNYELAEKRKNDLETKKTTVKTDLDTYGSSVLATHEKRINELLAMFAAGFSISGTERSYVGGRPSSSYKLVINGVKIDLGDERTPANQPSFRNTLSAGDKSTLALALFISQLERDPNLKDKIVVFDDPFTSQDRSRRTATQSIICNVSKRVTQTFVLSHDPYFLRAIWDAYKGGGQIKSFQFMRMGNGTSVGEWNVEQETVGEYAKKHRILWGYRHNTGLPASPNSPREVAQTIRPLLEEYLRLKLPHSFADNEWLGDFISKIRNAQDTDPLAAAKGILERIENINEYSKRYHHSTNPAFSTEPIDETELMNYVTQTLDIVGGF